GSIGGHPIGVEHEVSSLHPPAQNRGMRHPGADFAKMRRSSGFASAPGPWSPVFMSSFCRSLILATAVAATCPTLHADESPAGSTPDIEHGKATFNTMCSVCHSVKAGGGPVEGPNLLGLVGRPAGSQPAFARYSEALKASGIVWSTETLDRFL